jgi:chromosomal replication initiator protein
LRIAYQVVEPPRVTPSLPSQPPARGKEEGFSGLNQRYTFDAFVIGPGNRFAHAASVAVSESPAKQYNPLFIYGPTGLGKTHLLHSIANATSKRHPEFKILYISSEKFTNQLISAIQTKTTPQFRAKYRSLDLLLIDDVHFIAEKNSTQEEFFNTFNALYDALKQIVVTSDRPPREIPGLEERLVSRFGWGLVTDIQPPDFETRVAILKKKMELETVVVPDDVAYFIAGKIKSNIRELEGALIRVVAYCTLTDSKVDVRLAQEILKDSFKEEAQKFTIDGIQKTVADYFNVKVSDLRAKRRTVSIVRPRQIAMYLIRELTTHSFPEIGEFFGGKDHTTVLHSYNKIAAERDKDVSVRSLLDKLIGMLKK